MPGRTFNGSEYRYGHNGQEKEDEIAGAGNVMSAEYWMYDSRLLRRWERDPIVKPWESSYAAFNNNPILFADPLGLDGDDKGNKVKKGDNITKSDKASVDEIEIVIPKPENPAPSTRPTEPILRSVPTGGEGGVATGTQPVHEKDNSWWGAITRWLDRLDKRIERKTVHSNDDNPFGRKPVQTTFSGLTPYGDGGSKNINFFGDPENSTDGMWPGVTIYSMGKQAPGLKLPEFFEKMDKGMGMLDNGGDAAGKIIDKIVDAVKDDGPQKTTHDTVYKKMNTPDGGTYRYIIKNADGDSIGGAYYCGPPKNRNK